MSAHENHLTKPLQGVAVSYASEKNEGFLGRGAHFFARTGVFGGSSSNLKKEMRGFTWMYLFARMQVRAVPEFLCPLLGCEVIGY
jgi:hypothetical protein